MKSCLTCPFAYTDESERVQNYGCIPSASDIVKEMASTNKNWACHDDNKICRGAANHHKEHNLPFDKNKGLLFEVGVHGNINFKLDQ